MAKITLDLNYVTFLATLTSFNFGWEVLRWVAWTIWSDACLLDQITYVILHTYELWKQEFSFSFYHFVLLLYIPPNENAKLKYYLWSLSWAQTLKWGGVIIQCWYIPTSKLFKCGFKVVWHNHAHTHT